MSEMKKTIVFTRPRPKNGRPAFKTTQLGQTLGVVIDYWQTSMSEMQRSKKKLGLNGERIEKYF
jgi:hypothetical protein